MCYNGLGERISMTPFAGSTAITPTYTLDLQWRAYPRAVTTAGNSTLYLYGRGPLGEYTPAWSFMLADGTGAARQAGSPTSLTQSGSYSSFRPELNPEVW
jgi:hypothetical protein